MDCLVLCLPSRSSPQADGKWQLVKVSAPAVMRYGKPRERSHCRTAPDCGIRRRRARTGNFRDLDPTPAACSSSECQTFPIDAQHKSIAPGDTSSETHRSQWRLELRKSHNGRPTCGPSILNGFPYSRMKQLLAGGQHIRAWLSVSAGVALHTFFTARPDRRIGVAHCLRRGGAFLRQSEMIPNRGQLLACYKAIFTKSSLSRCRDHCAPSVTSRECARYPVRDASCVARTDAQMQSCGPARSGHEPTDLGAS
ncbi:hypothetical protein CBOM_07867 [Ceraceosorus bombacis]|uniref:Uncharacterized protein n=1 Tax=Ceraceosorus bombacis TaxID=401625 RepID=A0A0N7LB51_9BASI|nr:hypothetical protein CBOM_07867 [Ceraceosorus bombacis]